MRVGLIGDPLGHSFSPRLHAAFGTADYELHPIPAEALPAFFRERAFEGVNVTIPHKIAVIPLLDELHPSAEECGAVNTVVNRGGKLTGYNTDIFGMSFALAHAGISLSGRHVVILGSGGTSHTARALAKREGAASVTVVSRSGEVNYSNIAEFTETEIVINTTPVGMFPHADASPVDLTVFPRLRGVFDAVFNPLRTRLIEQAENLGVPVASGLLMLTAQAKAANTLFRGGDYSEPSPASEVGAEILNVWREVTAELTNIVLIGMPSSGKTTVGTLLAERLRRPLIDTDAETRLTVSECARGTGVIIATGGGAPMFPENRAALAGNGFVVLILRDTEKLDTTGRPLSRDLDTLKAMYKVRMPVYKAFADAEAVNNDTPSACAELILEKFYENFGHQRS